MSQRKTSKPDPANGQPISETGVDFRVKSVTVEGRPVALQLWDTAGQERFRSITKQYFRKADGVIIVYDVTSEESFKNVRAWVSALQVRSQISFRGWAGGRGTNRCIFSTLLSPKRPRRRLGC